MQEQTFWAMKRLCPSVPPETGGYIGKKADIICEFEFDPGIVQTNTGIYVPNVIRLNAVMKRWNDNGISFCGILHTHLPGQELLSSEDKLFITDIMDLNKNLFPMLYFPVLIPDNGLYLYQAVRRNNKVKITSVLLQLVEKEWDTC